MRTRNERSASPVSLKSRGLDKNSPPKKKKEQQARQRGSCTLLWLLCCRIAKRPSEESDQDVSCHTGVLILSVEHFGQSQTVPASWSWPLHSLTFIKNMKAILNLITTEVTNCLTNKTVPNQVRPQGGMGNPHTEDLNPKWSRESAQRVRQY